MKNYAQMKQLIASSGGKFCSVTFIKRDGTVRKMNVQPAALKLHIKGEDASERAKRAVATRQANHPELLPVWDNSKLAVRSVNLDTVTQIKVLGAVYEF